MGVLTLVGKYEELEEVISKAEEELKLAASDWNITGKNMIEIINKLSF